MMPSDPLRLGGRLTATRIKREVFPAAAILCLYALKHEIMGTGSALASCSTLPNQGSTRTASWVPLPYVAQPFQPLDEVAAELVIPIPLALNHGPATDLIVPI